MKRKKPGEAARSFLKDVRNSARRIEALEMRREFLRSVVFPGAIRYKTDLVQESAPDDRMAKYMADIEALHDDIRRIAHEARCDRKIAEEVLDDIEDYAQRRVLELYYLTTYPTYEEIGKTHLVVSGRCNRSWPDVAREMRMHIRHVHAIHRAALITFEEVSYLPEELYWMPD